MAADPTRDVDSDARASRGRRPGAGRLLLAVIVLLTGLTLVAGYANKARCVGPEFDAQGRSTPDFTAGTTATSATRTSRSCGWAATSTSTSSPT